MCGGSLFPSQAFSAGAPDVIWGRKSCGFRLNYTFRRGVSRWSVLLHLHIRRSFYITSAVRVVACARSGAFGGALLSAFLGTTKSPVRRTGDRSCPTEIRTPNLLIRSQMLYPLSFSACSSLVSSTRRGNRYYLTDDLEGVQAEKLEICPKSPPCILKIPHFAA